ncbi:LysR substrate-binding domain-containing protein [Arthrobacter sp. zg-Y820]|uniref:LysR family transcriptional regulator n=1 Tax=unclassified Arthrobacter TaxID=235627 RepID=UPI0025421F74|nr:MULTISPECIES: LysR substrate-binding domain-containing protein [unclassified Arthrobacter]MCC9196726.1 LysR substrate-binding domain-containing protein [Arthrobacter sp. zg-Y820]MDK1279588.1 LysR substrate-binding domain-containing protein [Arthrobacter sp. zg.Y820]WIB08040.1 LysR substrate-binding domain-containing protein [Arthrobacter sp. zg-Y820]
MDVRHLKYFLAVVDHQGFTRAAERLLIAQPSLSQTIKSLERDLGVPLFHRVGRNVVLSEAGRELVGPARVVVRDLEAARAAIDELKGMRRGRLDVIAMPSPAIEPLTSIITAYARTHPTITVNVDAAFTQDDVVAAVRDGSSEVGLLGSDRPFRAADIDVLHLGRQPLMLVLNPEEALPGGEAVGWEELSGHRMIVSQRGSLMRWAVDEALANGVALEIAVEVAHRTSILPLVLAGIGHAVLPSAWAPLARQAGLRTVRLEPETLLHISALSRAAELTPAALAFLAVAAATETVPAAAHG